MPFFLCWVMVPLFAWSLPDAVQVRLETGAVFHNSPTIRHLQLQTRYNPLLYGNQNLYLGNDSYGFIHGHIDLQPFKALSFHASPYLVVQGDRSSRNLHWTRGYVSAHLRSLSLDVGYMQLDWGLNQGFSLLFSPQTDPMPMVKLRTHQRIDLKNTFLAFLGAADFELLYSPTDDQRRYPNGHMVGSRLIFYPSEHVTFQIAQSVIYGGDGSPSNNPWVIVNESFLGDGSNPANRNFLLGVRWHIPRLGITPYADMYVEDCCSTNIFNPRDSNYLMGLHIDQLGMEGKTTVNIEWAQTSNVTYTHHFSPTYKGRVMGHPLGPDAAGLYINLTHQATPTLQIGGAWSVENRGRLGAASFHKTFKPITDVEPRFESPEQRVGLALFSAWRQNNVITWKTQLAMQRTLHQNYAFNNNQYHYLGEVRAEVRF